MDNIFFVFGLLTLMVERLTEYVFSTLFDKVPVLTPFKWALMYVALAVGVAAAFVFDLDLLAVAGLEHNAFGVALTGLAIGGGSNLLHEFLSFFKKP